MLTFLQILRDFGLVYQRKVRQSIFSIEYQLVLLTLYLIHYSAKIVVFTQLAWL